MYSNHNYQKVDNEILKKTVVEQLRHVFTQVGNVDLDYIKNEFTNFCINQNLKGVILQSVDLLKAGSYDRIKDLVDNVMKVGKKLIWVWITLKILMKEQQNLKECCSN